MGICFFLLSISVRAEALEPFATWENVLFEQETQYTISGNQVVATSHQAASGLVLKRRIDVSDTPRLTWSWKIVSPLPSLKTDEQSKAGDDFSARLYVIKNGFFPWQTKAINYVWSNQYPIDSYWPNPYTTNAMMVVVGQSNEPTKQWHTYIRDVKKDFKTYFDIEVDTIDAIAIMTDTDNTKSRAEAIYSLPSFQ